MLLYYIVRFHFFFLFIGEDIINVTQKFILAFIDFSSVIKYIHNIFDKNKTNINF